MGILDFVRGKPKVIYIPGSIESEKFPSHVDNYREILRKLSVSFSEMPVEFNSGASLYMSGYKKDSKRLAIKNYDSFKVYGASKIITSSAVDFWMFKQVYPTLVKDFDIEVEHIMTTILGGLNSKGVRYNGVEELREKVSYQDPCFLGRRMGIVMEPRKIIEILGGRVIEMKDFGRDSFCCGASGGVQDNEPEISIGAAGILVSEVPKESSRLICGAGICFANIVRVEEKAVDFSSFVLGKIRGLGL